MKVYRSRRSGRAIRETYDKLLSTWGCDIAELDVSTPCGATHVVACGREDAPPLVLFHGVGDDAALMWVYNAAALSRHFRIYAVDTLGGPGKSVPNERYNKAFDDVLWIDAVLDALGVHRAFFAGVSHGAYLVQIYALNRPDRVLKGIAIAGSVPVGGKGGSMKAMMKIFLPEALFPTDRNVVRLIRKLSGDHYAALTENPDIMAHYKCLLRGFNNMAMGYHKVLGMTPEEIDRIRDKIVYLVGADDPFQKIGGREALTRHHMNAVHYERAGHGLNHELADEINSRIISEFLPEGGA